MINYMKAADIGMHPIMSFFHRFREKTKRLLQSTDLCVPQTGASNIFPNGNYSVVLVGTATG